MQGRHLSQDIDVAAMMVLVFHDVVMLMVLGLLCKVDVINVLLHIKSMISDLDFLMVTGHICRNSE